MPTFSFLVVRFEVFTAVTMKNGVFWIVTQCGSCKNRRFGGTWSLSGTFLRSVRRLLVAACVVPSAPIVVTLMKEAPGSPKRRFLQEPHGVTTQKTPFFIVTAVKTSNLTAPQLSSGG
jgi:hypothetical protein